MFSPGSGGLVEAGVEAFGGGQPLAPVADGLRGTVLGRYPCALERCAEAVAIGQVGAGEGRGIGSGRTGGLGRGGLGLTLHGWLRLWWSVTCPDARKIRLD